LLFQTFDADYIRRLAAGDAFVESHFSAYFGELLTLKLRARLRSPQLMEDIRQETLLRVLKIVRNQGVEHPERFGGLVCAVCNNVLMEMLRSDQRHDQLEPEAEPEDEKVDLDSPLVNEQNRRQVEKVLAELPEKDRQLLRMYFLEERDKRDICKHFGVADDYLRVLLHRAKGRFRAIYVKRQSAVH
jgi:RNA polymerase sigma-70 factor (ECF subfamily)